MVARTEARTPGGIGRNGLFAEDVLVTVDAGGEMNGAEAWGRGEDDNVDAGVDEFLIGVETEELLGFIDF